MQKKVLLFVQGLFICRIKRHQEVIRVNDRSIDHRLNYVAYAFCYIKGRFTVNKSLKP